MDIITYALCKKLIAASASGISNIELNGNTMTITTNSGESFNLTFPVPADGVDGASIAAVQVNKSNHLICTLTDGTEIDAGEIKTIKGADGATPYIGENNNWWIKDTDTGVAANINAVTAITLNEEGHLIYTMSDGSTIDAGATAIKDLSILQDQVTELINQSELKIIE